MSEAENTAYEADLIGEMPLSVGNPADPQNGDFPSAPQEDDWQTVDFPNAIRVDDLIRETCNSAANSAEDPILSMTTPELVDLVQLLREHNRSLHERVAQLEAAIADRQRTVQATLVQTRQEEYRLAQQTQESSTITQEQITRLFQELEAGHQAAQRQQILIETLTLQLESSQERVAQLERDCALTQQRHDEQVQLLMQAEHTCRDLRARLHRQQRQTLQFKAALERCLEMSPSIEVADSTHLAVSSRRSIPNFPYLMPRTQPVQPWAAQSQLPMKVLELGHLTESVVASTPTPADPAPAEDRSLDRGNPPQLSLVEMAPESLTHRSPGEDLEADPWLTESEVEGPISLPPEIERQIDRVVNSLISQSETGENGLWEELSRLIGLPMTAQEELSEADVAAAEVPEALAEDLQEEAIAAPAPNVTPITSIPSLGEVIDLFETLRSSPSEATNPPLPPSPQGSEQAPPEGKQETGEVAPSPWLQAHGPSPVVYPLRPSKKLTSLAAVELPTFPRKEGPSGGAQPLPQPQTGEEPAGKPRKGLVSGVGSVLVARPRK